MINGEHKEYSYSEIVEIFAISTYLKDKQEIQGFIDAKYDLIDYKNQKRYNNALNDKIKTKEKWNSFLKDTIEYFIELNREYTIKYYTQEGYNKRLNLFNDNYTFDIKKKKPIKYWKVYFLIKKEYKPIPLIQEQYINNKLFLKVYYDENLKKVKEEYHLRYPKSNKVLYYSYGAVLN